MKNSSAWAFGIFFLAICIFFWWNGFEIPRILLGKTNSVNGVVIKNKRVVVKNGYMEFIRYAYKIDTTWYFGYKTLGNRDGYHGIGKEVLVEYVIKKPWKSKMLKGFSSSYASRNLNVNRYIKGENTGYLEIELNNSLMFKRKHTLYDKIATEYIGKFWFSGDTLYFDPLGLIINESLEEIESLHNKKDQFLKVQKDSLQAEQLIDLRNGNVYKLVQ